ncbi:MAG: ABC transporter permease [Treponema sp.]|nr:ABC transporter permease [Treponema sp.]MCL2236693.1 ABC transporter permease [Treponema sp.]
MKLSWILFVAFRYIFRGRSNSPVLSVVGIAVGVLALIVIIAVMNGFQLSFIESILEISSYHLRLESFDEEKTGELQNIMLSVPGVKSAVPFREFQALARGKRTSQQAVLVRGVHEDAAEADKMMDSRLSFEDGYFNLTNNDNVLLGAELARRLGAVTGDAITLFSITGILSAEDEDSGLESFTVAGIFRTGYYEYDYSWAFINMEKVSKLDNESDLVLGIKIANRFQDKNILEQARKKLGDYEGIKLSSWRDYNRSFFGALRTEKLFMFILVGLIFIVVGLNIFQAQRRSVMQRREEIGLLRAVGGSRMSVQSVFVLDGGLIGFSGAGIGLGLGLAIASNIPIFFSGIEKIVNSVINLINIIAYKLGFGLASNFSVFSPAVFYIKEIPSRVIAHEVIIIFMFGFLSALAAGWIASGKAAKIQPAEVLRYE